MRTRWSADPRTAFAGELAGSNFATNWGSVGFFGPLTIHPKFWDRGVGKRLIEPVIDLFAKWETEHAGLFTFAHSPKHLGLYQRFGFLTQFLTVLMSKSVGQRPQPLVTSQYSELSVAEQEAVIRECRELTNAKYPGLDVHREIRAVAAQGLGDTILLRDEKKLVAMAVCHMGEGTEAGSETCYVKFAAVRPGATAEQHFSELLDACEAVAAANNLSRLLAGVNTARREAYQKMMALDFRTEIQGVVMQRSGDQGYNRPGVWILDDWR